VKPGDCDVRFIIISGGRIFRLHPTSLSYTSNIIIIMIIIITYVKKLFSLYKHSVG